MEREEILKRAQGEQRDERELQVKDKSVMWAYIVMTIMAAVFSYIRSTNMNDLFLQKTLHNDKQLILYFA